MKINKVLFFIGFLSLFFLIFVGCFIFSEIKRNKKVIHLSLNLLNNTSGKILFSYKYVDYNKLTNNSIIKIVYPINILKKERQYVLSIGKSKVLEAKYNKSNSEDLLAFVIANIEPAYSLLLSGNGQILNIINPKKYISDMELNLELMKNQNDTELIKNVKSRIEKENYVQKILDQNKEVFRFVFTYWHNRNLELNRYYVTQGQLVLPLVSNKVLKTKYLVYLDKVYYKNNKKYILINVIEIIDPKVLYLALHETKNISYEEFKQKSYKYKIVHRIDTEIQTLLPLKYKKTIQISLPDINQEHTEIYEFLIN